MSEEYTKVEKLELNNSDLWTGKTNTDLIVDKINEIIDKIDILEEVLNVLIQFKLDELEEERLKLLKGSDKE